MTLWYHSKRIEYGWLWIPLTVRGGFHYFQLLLYPSAISRPHFKKRKKKISRRISAFQTYWLISPRNKMFFKTYKFIQEFNDFNGTPTKRQVSKRQVSKRLVSKRPASKRQVYKTSGLQKVRFQNVWFPNVQFLNLISLLNKKYRNCQVSIPI